MQVGTTDFAHSLTTFTAGAPDYNKYLFNLMQRVELPHRGLDIYIAAILHQSFRFDDLNHLRAIKRDLMTVVDTNVDGDGNEYSVLKADKYVLHYTNDLDDLHTVLCDYYEEEEAAMSKLQQAMTKCSLQGNFTYHTLIKNTLQLTLMPNTHLLH